MAISTQKKLDHPVNYSKVTSSAEKNRTPSQFDATKLKKLHLVLKHGSATAMEDSLKSSDVWHPDLKKSIEELLLECACKVAKEPLPHPVVSTNRPVTRKQTAVSLDVLFLEGVPVMHAVDKCIGWSETSVLFNRSHTEQVSTFAKIWIYRHGLPKKIHADRKYFRGGFAKFCKDTDIELVELAANDHEANGIVERANCTLRSFFRRLRSEDKKLSLSNTLSEATYAKNISKGSKMTSSFRLLYGQHPLILSEFDNSKIPLVSVEEHVKCSTKNRLEKLVSSRPRKPPTIKIGDYVFYWRDKLRWLGPAKVVDVGENIIKFVHDEQTLTSSYNHVQKTIPPTYPITEEDDDDMPALPQLSANESRSCEHNLRQSESQNDDINLQVESKKIQTRSHSHKESCTAADTKNASDRGSSKLPWISGEFNLELPDDDSANSFFKYATQVPLTMPERLEAYRRERDNWRDMNAMEVVSTLSVPRNANIIGSHVRYVRKMNGKVKARICPWGNHDAEKNFLRGDAPSMLMEVFRLAISIGVENGCDIGSMDVRAAFLQANGFTRTIYVRPPREEKQSTMLWRLLSPAYGLVDSGRLRYLTSNSALCDEYGLTRSKYEPTLYFSRNENNELDFLVVVQVDNYIYTGTESRVTKFENYLRNAFEVGETYRNNFDVYGATLTRLKDGTVILNQKKKLHELGQLKIMVPSKLDRSGNDVATVQELSNFRSIIGSLLFVGRMSHPILMRIASSMTTKTSALKVHYLRDLQSQLKCALDNAPVLVFRRRNSKTKTDFRLEIYTDGAMGTKKDSTARGGYIIFRRNGDITHPIFWCSRRLRRIARSSSPAEILAAADGVDKAFYICTLLSEIYKPTKLDFGTDSRSLFQLVATRKEPEEASNKIDLSMMREIFEMGKICRTFWLPANYLIADALTEDNRITNALLNKVLVEGAYPHHPDQMEFLTPKRDV